MKINTENNYIELEINDVYRLNGARTHYKVINIFDYDGETYINVIKTDSNRHHIDTYNLLKFGSIHILYGNVWNGISEVNGMKIRGIGGKLLKTQKVVTSKIKEETKHTVELTDFQKFVKVQQSGKINMTDIETGSMLAGISTEKYEDILWHYSEYKSGKLQ